MMTEPALAVLQATEGTPHERLARFVVVSLSGAVADPRLLSLWATFISQIHIDPNLSRAHRAGYHAYRNAAEALIGQVLDAEGRATTDAERKRAAIAISAVIDGLWIEGGLSDGNSTRSLQVSIGPRSWSRRSWVFQFPDITQKRSLRNALYVDHRTAGGTWLGQMGYSPARPQACGRGQAGDRVPGLSASLTFPR